LATEYKVANGGEIQICNFEPNGNSIIYILDNTIYYADESLIRSGNSVQISEDGEPGVIYHGIPDWVYEEEMLGSDAAAWFSPDGRYLAYASFNDTLVPDFTYEIYQDGTDKYLYPEEIHLRYPKVKMLLFKLNLE
jgi:dipeptidyl-peptidase 4